MVDHLVCVCASICTLALMFIMALLWTWYMFGLREAYSLLRETFLGYPPLKALDLNDRTMFNVGTYKKGDLFYWTANDADHEQSDETFFYVFVEVVWSYKHFVSINERGELVRKHDHLKVVDDDFIIDCVVVYLNRMGELKRRTLNSYSHRFFSRLNLKHQNIDELVRDNIGHPVSASASDEGNGRVY